MHEINRYPVPPSFAKTAHMNQKQYAALYQQSVMHPDVFWGEQAARFISWLKPWKTVQTGHFDTLDVQWFTEAKLNACYNCVDRHLETRGAQTALLWEGNHPGDTKAISYQQLHEKVCRLANVLKREGVQKGDRVCIYLPMIPEAIIAMLACARIGAVHSVVFAGFSPEALKTRILDANCCVLITADEGKRGDKTVPLKQHCDAAIIHCPNVRRLLVVQQSGNRVAWDDSRDMDYEKAMSQVNADCPIEPMDSSDPLFILYTSGSTGKPKGIVHATGGYLVYVACTHHYVFDYHPGDVYWCTADIGWITGHSYAVYGPLANGATTLLFEGVPHYPSFSRLWEIVDKHHVNILYTAPTALRALRREGDTWVKKSHRKSLKLLGTVGEPINPDVWAWYFDVVGDGRCPIVDTWWQTETGGILITPLPGATPLKPGSATLPFLGVVPDIVDSEGMSITDDTPGRLVITAPWPGMMQSIYGDKQRFRDTYFEDVPGCYLTGDGAYRDVDGYYTITGRNDDVIKVSGHRFGTEELESALLHHPTVSEAAVVGVPHAITGESIYAFVTLKQGIEASDSLRDSLIQHVREMIGPIAKPDVIHWATGLPKTRSGKIMRRILRKIAAHDVDALGDISTLADPSVVDELISGMSGDM